MKNWNLKLGRVAAAAVIGLSSLPAAAKIESLGDGFSGLTGGEYRLVLSGRTTPQIDLNDPLRPAYDQGTPRTLAAPVPEPGVMGMALLGLLGVGISSARRPDR